jgi:nucleotide-binding universal stress UspA family protein
MKQFNKVLVGLDLTEMDHILIEKTSKLINALGIDKIYFVHVGRDLSLPEDVAKAYPDLLAPVDEAIKKDIQSKVREWVPDTIEVDISVKEGNPMETILRWAKIKNIDLLIMGRKIQLDGQGTLAKNLAQKAPCSVLFLTEDLKIRDLEHILVPMDFSEHSHLTLKFVERLSQNFHAKISCLHIYEVPTGYYKTGKSYHEFAQIMEKNAHKEYQTFLAKHNLPHYDCKFILKEDDAAAKYIMAAAKNHQVDMVIMGSRGRTDPAAFLLGSVAEKLIQINNEIPMLILKKKGENMTFLEALLKL